MTSNINEKLFSDFDLSTNIEYLSVLKKIVNESIHPAFLCSQIKIENPNYFSIIYSNNLFIDEFGNGHESLIGKSHDFLFEEIGLNYDSVDQNEYSRMIIAIKNKQEGNFIFNLPVYHRGIKEVLKFQLKLVPFFNQENKKTYLIFVFEKQNDNSVKNSYPLSQNQILIKTLERSLSNEKLLRQISYLIISDKTIKEISLMIAELICYHLKVDRCIINDIRDDKPNFIVEFSNFGSRYITYGDESVKEEDVKNYVIFHNEFYKKISSENSVKNNSSLFVVNDIRSDPAFYKFRKIYQDFNVFSEITAITSFDNKINGSIHIHCSERRNFNMEEIQLLEIISEQLSIAIDRSYSVERVMIANHKLLIRTLELKQAIKKEKELRKTQSEFVALVSHEFKTPLQIIDSNREMISRKIKNLNLVDDSILKYLEKIKSGIFKMNGLISTTLNLARIESGREKMGLNKVKFYINDLIYDIIDKVNNLALSKNISINLLNFDNPIEIFADQKMLDHAFTNLISNAIKYSRDNLSVDITLLVSNKNVIVEVLDRGIGIPEEDLKNIGKKFFRARNTLSVSGTGIGLYITKYFIELHNGFIEVDSKIDVGSKFSISIPLF